MIDQERIRRLQLEAKGYPVKIRTGGGKFFYTEPPVGAFVHNPSTSWYLTLADAIKYAIWEVETRQQRYFAL